MIPTKIRQSAESAHDQRTALVKGMVEKESAAQDAKTVRLRALRLAREAEEKAAAPPAKRKSAKPPRNGRG